MAKLIAFGRLARSLAPGKLNEFEAIIPELIPASLDVKEAYEVVLQSYLFFGYAQTIEALRLFSVTLSSAGVAMSFLPPENLSADAISKRGEGLCRKIYAPNYERLMANMKSISPELADWMVTEGYGKVLSRKGLTEIEREIVSIVFLTCSNHPVQIYSHVRGARNLGATRQELMTVVSAVGFDKSQQSTVAEIIDKVFAQ